MKKSKESLKDLWEVTKRFNMNIMRLPKRAEKKKGAENVFEEIMALNFPNLRRKMDTQIHKSQSPKVPK